MCRADFFTQVGTRCFFIHILSKKSITFQCRRAKSTCFRFVITQEVGKEQKSVLFLLVHINLPSVAGSFVVVRRRNDCGIPTVEMEGSKNVLLVAFGKSYWECLWLLMWFSEASSVYRQEDPKWSCLLALLA